MSVHLEKKSATLLQHNFYSSCFLFLFLYQKYIKMAASDHTCLAEGCSKTATLQCPTCIKLKIEGSYFCSQDCFKKNWVNKKGTFLPLFLW